MYILWQSLLNISKFLLRRWWWWWCGWRRSFLASSRAKLHSWSPAVRSEWKMLLHSVLFIIKSLNRSRIYQRAIWEHVSICLRPLLEWYKALHPPPPSASHLSPCQTEELKFCFDGCWCHYIVTGFINLMLLLPPPPMLLFSLEKFTSLKFISIKYLERCNVLRRTRSRILLLYVLLPWLRWKDEDVDWTPDSRDEETGKPFLREDSIEYWSSTRRESWGLSVKQSLELDLLAVGSVAYTEKESKRIIALASPTSLAGYSVGVWSVALGSV